MVKFGIIFETKIDIRMVEISTNDKINMYPQLNMYKTME